MKEVQSLTMHSQAQMLWKQITLQRTKSVGPRVHREQLPRWGRLRSTALSAVAIKKSSKDKAGLPLEAGHRSGSATASSKHVSWSGAPSGSQPGSSEAMMALRVYIVFRVYDPTDSIALLLVNVAPR